MGARKSTCPVCRLPATECLCLDGDDHMPGLHAAPGLTVLRVAAEGSDADGEPPEDTYLIRA